MFLLRITRWRSSISRTGVPPVTCPRPQSHSSSSFCVCKSFAIRRITRSSWSAAGMYVYAARACVRQHLWETSIIWTQRFCLLQCTEEIIKVLVMVCLLGDLTTRSCLLQWRLFRQRCASVPAQDGGRDSPHADRGCVQDSAEYALRPAAVYHISGKATQTQTNNQWL